VSTTLHLRGLIDPRLGARVTSWLGASILGQ
jgi:hypothetical protein